MTNPFSPPVAAKGGGGDATTAVFGCENGFVKIVVLRETAEFQRVVASVACRAFLKAQKTRRIDLIMSTSRILLRKKFEKNAIGCWVCMNEIRTTGVWH